jgi:hypothetical protein
MASTKMFRDRVVSMEQTQEIGEKHLGLLTELVTEALPGWLVAEHGLDHEPDLFYLVLTHGKTGETKRVTFTRMVLSDAGRLPAIVEDRNAPVRGRLVEVVRSRAGRPEIALKACDLLTDEEQAEADAIEAEWRKKHDAELAAKRAEDERRERERQRKRQEEEARRRAQRERAPQEAQTGANAGRQGRSGRRRRGRGGPGGPGGQAGPGPQATQPRKADLPQARPQPPRPQQPGPSTQGQPGSGGGGRRRRRRGRRGGGSDSSGGGVPPPPPQGAV